MPVAESERDMIRENFDRVFGAHKVKSPAAYGVVNLRQFLFVDFAVALCGGALAREVGDHLQAAAMVLPKVRAHNM